MLAIGKELSRGKYDIVSLQEVWTENDNQLLQKLTKAALPYAHYFYRYEKSMDWPICLMTILVRTIDSLQVEYLGPDYWFYRDFPSSVLCFMRGPWTAIFIASNMPIGMVAKEWVFVGYALVRINIFIYIMPM